MKTRKQTHSTPVPQDAPEITPVEILGVNLVTDTIHVQAVATVGFVSAAPLGLPIMREGFITETGFLPPSPRPYASRY